MKSLNLKQVTEVDSISKRTFKKEFLKAQKPVIIKDLTSNWSAKKYWNFDYIKEIAGNKIVPLYDDRPVNYTEKFNQPHTKMKLSQYIDLLQKEPTRYRIFLYNLLKEIPELKNDFTYPDLGISFLKSLPMLFFGGMNSHTFMHYDIDLANIFHFHFEGRKTCTLFAPSETKYLYKIPYSLITHEEIDFKRPDLEKWPALSKAKGSIAHLQHGDVLYIPEGYWHYMYYNTPGFSLSLRSLPRNIKNLSKALYNLFIMRSVENLCRKFIGEKWLHYKQNIAINKTEKNLKKYAKLEK
jgi:hypothetical protein